MKTLLPVVTLAALSAAAFCFAATEKSDLTLNDGRVLKGAHIVAIGNEQVSIVHAGGSVTVLADLVPLDVLTQLR